MPVKDSKHGHVRAILSWVNYVLQEASRSDPLTVRVLLVQRWYRQYWQAKHPQGDGGHLELAPYDARLDGMCERLFEHNSISRLPDLDNPPDIPALFKNLTSENLLALIDALRGRLIQRLHEPSSIDQDSGLNDPIDIVAPLKTLTRDELKRVTQVLYDELPLPRKSGLQGAPWEIDLPNFDLWCAVEHAIKSDPSKSVMQACMDVTDNYKHSKKHTNGAVRKRYIRTDARLKNFMQRCFVYRVLRDLP